MRYRVNIQIRRMGQAPLDQDKTEYRSEEFFSDEELSETIAADVLRALGDDREYLDSVEGTEDYERNTF